MRERSDVLRVVAGWAQEAENDLAAARQTLKLGQKCRADTVCFHAQQCVEKYIKAPPVWRGTNFPRTHLIEQIVPLLPPELRPGLTPEEQERLSYYATVTRYPGDYGPLRTAEARCAVAVARRVRTGVRRLLPRLPRTSQRE